MRTSARPGVAGRRAHRSRSARADSRLRGAGADPRRTGRRPRPMSTRSGSCCTSCSPAGGRIRGRRPPRRRSPPRSRTRSLPRLASVVRALDAGRARPPRAARGRELHRLGRRLARRPRDDPGAGARSLPRAPLLLGQGTSPTISLRYLDGRPVEARPDSRWYRARKFARRHRVAVVAAALVALSLVAGLSAALWQARRAARNAIAAEAQLAAGRARAGLSDPDRSKGRIRTARRARRSPRASCSTRAPPVSPASSPENRRSSRRSGTPSRRSNAGWAATTSRCASRAKRSRSAGGGSPRTIPRWRCARLTLGEALFANGDLQAAKAELAAALPVLVASLGEESDEVLRARSALGGAELHLGDNAAALASSDFVLEHTRRKSGAESAEAAQALLEHAMALGAADRYPEAEAAAAESVALFTRRLGADHPRTARARMTWGELLEYVGQRAEAERELAAALPVVERTLGAGASGGRADPPSTGFPRRHHPALRRGRTALLPGARDLRAARPLRDRHLPAHARPGGVRARGLPARRRRSTSAPSIASAPSSARTTS